MKQQLLPALASLFLLAPLSAEVGDFGGTIELGAGIFDSDATPYYGGSIGLSYESSLGRHYLMLGGGFATQDDSSFSQGGFNQRIGTTDDVSLFNVGYRHGFVLSEKFEPYLEVGYGRASSDIGATDAFGNPVNFDRVSNHFYAAVGISYRLYENLHITGSVTYLALDNDTPFGEVRSDAFGNAIFQDKDINFLARLGLSYRF